MKMEALFKWIRTGRIGPRSTLLAAKRAPMEDKTPEAETHSAAKRMMELPPLVSADFVPPVEASGPITAVNSSETKMTGTTSLISMTTLATATGIAGQLMEA